MFCFCVWLLFAEDLRTQVRNFTEGRGVDVVFDPVGDRFCEPAVRSLAWRGRYITVGFAAGDIPRVPINLLLLKEASIIGSALREFDGMDKKGGRLELREFEDLIASGQLKPLVSCTAHLKDAVQVLHDMMTRQTIGKVVLVTDSYLRKYPHLSHI